MIQTIKFLFSGLEDGKILIQDIFAQEPMSGRYIDGHSKQVVQVLFSPDGNFLASFEDGKKIVIWSTMVSVLIQFFIYAFLIKIHQIALVCKNDRHGISFIHFERKLPAFHHGILVALN